MFGRLVFLLNTVGIALAQIWQFFRELFGRIHGQSPTREPLPLVPCVHGIRLFLPVVALLSRRQFLRLLLSAPFFLLLQCSRHFLPAPRAIHRLLETLDRLLETVEVSVPNGPGARDDIQASILQQVIQLLPSCELLLLSRHSLCWIRSLILRRLLFAVSRVELAANHAHRAMYV